MPPQAEAHADLVQRAAAQLAGEAAGEAGSDPADWMATVGEELAAAAAGKEEEVGGVLAAFKQSLATALVRRQEERLANQRLQAALANDFEMEATAGEQRVSGVTPAFAVSFKVGARKRQREEYTVVPKPLLRAIVRHIASNVDHRENLRPFNMALFSPRILWNLVRANEVRGAIGSGMGLLWVGGCVILHQSL
jgi:hypothetical protein